MLLTMKQYREMVLPKNEMEYASIFSEMGSRDHQHMDFIFTKLINQEALAHILSADVESYRVEVENKSGWATNMGIEFYNTQFVMRVFIVTAHGEAMAFFRLPDDRAERELEVSRAKKTPAAYIDGAEVRANKIEYPKTAYDEWFTNEYHPLGRVWFPNRD